MFSNKNPVMRLPASHDMQPKQLGRISYRAQFHFLGYPSSKSLTNHSEPSLNPLEANLCTRVAKHRKPLWTCQASKNSSTGEQFLDVRPPQIILASSHQSCQFLPKPPKTNSPWSGAAVNAMDFASNQLNPSPFAVID